MALHKHGVCIFQDPSINGGIRLHVQLTNRLQDILYRLHDSNLTCSTFRNLSRPYRYRLCAVLSDTPC